MSIAFTFPGQGSQAVGMGKALAEQFPEARAVFDEVDAALGEKLSRNHVRRPGGDADADRQRPAGADGRVHGDHQSDGSARLGSEGQGFAYVAGHSLGEYSALAAAGTFSISDTASLLRIRGNAMQAAVPAGKGAMAAIIGLDEEAVAKACKTSGNCQIANDNGGGQLVISGEKAAVEKAAALATEAGAKRAIMLAVSAPFHSSLMAPAAEAMKEALEKVAKRSSSIPLLPTSPSPRPPTQMKSPAALSSRSPARCAGAKALNGSRPTASPRSMRSAPAKC